MFRDTARQLVAQGWHPLPLPPRAKAPPPEGYTGAAGIDADSATIERWCDEFGDGNIALRLSSTVIGIDIDDYGYKHGAATLADLCLRAGVVLPPTFSVTARGVDSSSRVLLFRVDDGVKLPGVLGAGIDVLQHHHRYVTAPDSIHPDLGTRYEWWTPQHTRALSAPHINQLPLLSRETIAALVAAAGVMPASNGEREHVTTMHELLRTDEFADSIAAIIDDEHDWHRTLLADGWSMLREHQHESMWMRPGKEQAGVSAVLHETHGPLVVFTTSMPALQRSWALNRDGAGWSFSMFGYLAATRFDGDRSRCASEHRKARNADERRSMTLRTSALAAAVLDDDDRWRVMHRVPLNEAAAWSTNNDDEDWLAWPLVPRGAAVALYAPAKAGKSAVVLAMCVAASLGRSVFGHPAVEPIVVGYLDYEMTQRDVIGRLIELGYGPADRLDDRLAYCSLPSIPPLDTPAGAQQLVEWATEHGVQLVVIDTFARAVEGPENDADTVRSFFRLSGAALKHAGIAVLRTDHAGKDIERGMRGSSSKADDVDVVWQYARTDSGARLKATHRRLSSVLESIELSRNDDDGVTVWHRTEHAMPAGTAAMVDVLDQYGIDVELSIRATQAALRAARGKGGENAVITAAQRARRARADGAVLDTLMGEQKPVTRDFSVSTTRSDRNETTQMTSSSSHARSHEQVTASNADQSNDGGGCEPEKVTPPSGPPPEPFDLY